jgi:hypothetical protein
MALVNTVVHLHTLLQNEEHLSTSWKDRLNYMLLNAYSVCFKNSNGTFSYRRRADYHQVVTKDLVTA